MGGRWVLYTGNPILCQDIISGLCAAIAIAFYVTALRFCRVLGVEGTDRGWELSRGKAGSQAEGGLDPGEW